MLTSAVTFNTGRRYTAEGQVITAVLDGPAEKIAFFDHSRGIMGTIECPTHSQCFSRPQTLAAYTMERYDRGDYALAISGPGRCLEVIDMHL